MDISKICKLYLKASLEQLAKNTFKTTKNPLEVGYILQDGSMLDFSGRHESIGYENGIPKDDYLKNTRNVDHREISSLIENKDILHDSQVSAIVEFIKQTKAIRVSVTETYALFDMVFKPTSQQFNTISMIAKSCNKIDIEKTSLEGNSLAFYTIDFPNGREIKKVITEMF